LNFVVEKFDEEILCELGVLLVYSGEFQLKPAFLIELGRVERVRAQIDVVKPFAFVKLFKLAQQFSTVSFAAVATINPHVININFCESCEGIENADDFADIIREDQGKSSVVYINSMSAFVTNKIISHLVVNLFRELSNFFDFWHYILRFKNLRPLRDGHIVVAG